MGLESSKSCVHKSRCSVSSKLCGMARMHKGHLRGEEAVLKVTARWKWRRRRIEEIEKKRTELQSGASEDAEEATKAAELAGQAMRL